MAKRNKSSGFLKFLLFVIFLGLGVGGGYYLANKYLLEEEDSTPIATEIGTKDITNNSEFSETIAELDNFLKNKVYLYNSKGANIDSLDNDVKLKIAFDNVLNNKYDKEDTIPRSWYGSIYCANNFLVDSIENEDGTSTNQDYCKVFYITKSNLESGLRVDFKNGSVDLVDEYRPKDNLLCLLQEDGSYMCGKVVSSATDGGEIINKFEIVKVTIDEDNTIVIYDKGYLVDKRVGIEVNTNYSNYYLHSYDAESHYYELKSSDNLTFKHIFKLDENNKYYYVSSEVYK